MAIKKRMEMGYISVYEEFQGIGPTVQGAYERLLENSGGDVSPEGCMFYEAYPIKVKLTFQITEEDTF